ncbi:MAG: CCA tRNA nucleotidyltransferase [Flavobacteriales bacterium]
MAENYSHALTHVVFKVITQTSKALNIPAFVVGGFVRDFFLDRPCKDIDIVVLGEGPAFARAVADRLKVHKISIFNTYGTAHFRYKDLELEFVGARKESYSKNSRNPKTKPGTLKDDQERRDFTINALAFSLAEDSFGDLLDPFEGTNDLKAGILRTPLDPVVTFEDDPLRMMRAARFASQLGFSIAGNAIQAMHSQQERIHIVSMERIVVELNKIVLSNHPSKGFNILHKTGILGRIFPEMTALSGVETINGYTHKDNFDHTLEVLENVCKESNDLWLRWSAILHDIAKPATKRFDNKQGWTFHGHEEIGARMVPRIFKKLRLPLDGKMKFVQKMVRLHLRPIALVKGSVTDAAIRRLLSEAEDDIDFLMTLCNADITSKNEFKVKKYKKNFELVSEKLKLVEEKDRIRNFQPPVTGQDIMTIFGLSPCTEIGTIKQGIKEAILEGKIQNTREEAQEEMYRLAAALGIKPIVQ